MKKYFVKRGSLILPEQIQVGEREDFRNKNKKNDAVDGPVLVKIPVKVDFIPLRKILQKFFELSNVFQDTIDYLTNLENHKTIISNLVQGKFWKNFRRSFDETKFNFPITLYYDDYETNNPLGSHAGFGKIGAVYALLPGLPPVHQSKRENIFLVLSFNTLDRPVVGAEAIFRPAINELEYLKEHGITIRINN